MPITLVDLWRYPSMIHRLSEAERFALPGVFVGMRCNIAQYKLLRYLDGKQKPNWDELHDELLELDKNDAGEDCERPTIWLQGADLHEAQLEGAFLNDAHLEGADLCYTHFEGADLSVAHLEGAALGCAHLKGARLTSADLKGAHLNGAHLEGANLSGVYLEGAALSYAHLEGAGIRGSHLQGADVRHAHLKGADLCGSHLKGADLTGTHLANANLEGADLRNAVLRRADVRGASLRNVRLEGAHLSYMGTDGMTLIYPVNDGRRYAVDRETYAGGVALANIRISPGVRQLLEYNVRRERWLRWCGGRRGQRGTDPKPRWQHWAYKWPVWLFWQMSDYGKSTGRIAAAFAVLSILFAMAYRFLPGLVVCSDGKPLAGLWHAVYFSVVTMTTLGFGDIHASRDSGWGQSLLMFQVILGYVLLGALVCRLAILFQAGGPAAKFTKPPKLKPKEAGDTDE